MMLLFLATLLSLPASVQDGVRYPAKPGPRDFVIDEAKLLKPEDAAAVKAVAEEVLTKKRAPIIVVTIPSLAAYNAGSWPIERYAMNLMGEWGVGWEDWNYGMLLLVSPGDRKARIELGSGWSRRKDEDARRVLAERIIPRFKKGDYSGGILEGVKGLQAVALDAVPSRSPSGAASPTSSPKPVVPTAGIGCGLIALIVIGVVVVLFVSRMARGSTRSWGPSSGPYMGQGFGGRGGGGFGSGFGGGILGGALGSMLYNSWSNRSHGSTPPSNSNDFGGGSSGGGGGDSDFGGGSFGGGFSGGGGATGEW